MVGSIGKYLMFAMAFLLVACSAPAPTGNVVDDRGPARVCAVSGFTCLVTVAGSGTVSFTLRNTGQTELQDVSVALSSRDCALTPASVGIGRLPGGAQEGVRFTCAQPVSSFTGKIVVSYSTRTDSTVHTADGYITIREG